MIAVPPFRLDCLVRGHAIRFRCGRDDVMGMRIDVMAVMRGVAPFEALLDRRTTFRLSEDETIDALLLSDLVGSRKTQREDDWVMLRRLVEVRCFQHRDHPERVQIRFWRENLRTPSLLVELVGAHTDEAESMAISRPLLRFAQAGDVDDLERALHREEDEERARDRAYWAPLRKELEQFRRARMRT